MKPKHQRLIFVSVSVGFLCLSVMLALQAFRDNVVFFYAPSELPAASDKKIRVGGLVETGSIKRDGARVTFIITDGKTKIATVYEGMLPGLFREGQGVVVEGYVRDGGFEASQVLTKHDEFYMPREVKDALQKSGHWKGE